jgi:hypothetical protein
MEALKQRYYALFGKTDRYEIIFADTQKIVLQDSSAVDIILSPKYYWTKIEKLPVKYAFQAKEYAPSLFDGFIPKGDYSYKAIKQNDKFLLFAYDAKDILENLETIGIKISHIHNVYFAQTEFAAFPYDIKIDDKNALIIQNEKIIKAPLSLTQKHTALKSVLETLKLSKNMIKLGKFNRFYEKQSAVKNIIYILLFLIALSFGELIYLISISSAQESQKEEILQQYSLPSTELQLNALLKQHDRINKDQKAVREKMGEVFKFPFLEDEYFQSIEVSQKQISLTLHVSDKSRSESIRGYFQKSFTIDEFQNENDNIKIKLRYE